MVWNKPVTFTVEMHIHELLFLALETLIILISQSPDSQNEFAYSCHTAEQDIDTTAQYCSFAALHWMENENYPTGDIPMYALLS